MSCLIAGSAHLVICAKTNTSSETQVVTQDLTGQLSIDFGGSGYNASIALANQNVGVHFLSAVNTSTFSSIIIENMQDNNVEVFIRQEEDLPLSGAFIQMNELPNKKIKSTVVSSSAIETIEFSQEFINTAIYECTVALLDTSLCLKSLDLIGMTCKEKGIPYFVNVDANINATKLLNFKRSIAKPMLIFMDWSDVISIVKTENFVPNKLVGVAHLIGCPIIVVHINHGVYYANTDGVALIQIADFHTRRNDILRLLQDHIAAAFIKEYQPHQIYNNENLTPIFRNAVKSAHKSHDLNPVEKKMTEVRQNARQDMLTGLLNRLSGESQIKRFVKRLMNEHPPKKSSLIFFFMDIDKFKRINDTYGHDAGDLIIKGLAQNIKDSFRPVDICARWGGEEFLCALPNIDVKTAMMIAQRFRQRIESTAFEPCSITVSIGVSQYDPENDKGDFLQSIARADQALYEAKETGRNKVLFYGE